MKVTTVVGARPQFIKAATVSRVFRSKAVDEIIIHTGQHFDKNMSESFFREMGIPEPAYNLNINDLTHGAMTGRMIERIEEILIKDKPDFVLLYGDTNSTLAGALAAAKLKIPIAHVEAGLRSFNMDMPEEINRIVTDRLSSKLFCPTDKAVLNLENEGFGTFGTQVYLVGDVMYDAFLYYQEKAQTSSQVLQQLDLLPNSYSLVTIHRAENTNDASRLAELIKALNIISETETVVWPVHPRTKSILLDFSIFPGVRLVEPLGYLDMLTLTSNSSIVLTDSGGLQKEAYFAGKFCITLRDETEWTELVDAGVNALARANSSAILTQYNSSKVKSFPTRVDLYGKGDASHKIVEKILLA